MPKIYQIRNNLDIKNKIMVYNSWIVPHLLYGIEIYGNAKKNKINTTTKGSK
jgi:hypothetical protein